MQVLNDEAQTVSLDTNPFLLFTRARQLMNIVEKEDNYNLQPRRTAAVFVLYNFFFFFLLLFETAEDPLLSIFFFRCFSE